MNQSMKISFWTMFLAFLAPGVDDQTPPDDPPADDPQDPDPDPGDPSDDGDLDPPDPDPAPTARKSSTDELAALQEQNRALTAALQGLTARPQAPAAPTEEELALRNPDLDPNERFRIQANQAIRQTYGNAESAKQIALDAVDAAQFQLKCVTDPIARKYAAQVEKKRAEFIAQGKAAPPRDAMLTWVLGEQVRARASQSTGKGTSKPRQSSSEVPRGRTPNARSTVGSSAKTEREKRRERLEGVNI